MVRVLALLALGLGLVLEAPAQSIDKPVPDIEFKIRGNGSNNNNNQDAKDSELLIGKYRGRLVVLYFWRTGSRESVLELKDMKEFLDRYSDRGVTVIPICTDPKKRYDDWAKDQSDDVSATFREQVWGFRFFQHHYGVVAEPMVVLVDPRGILRWRGHPNDALERRIERMLELYPAKGADSKWLSGRLRAAQVWLDRGEVGRAYTIATQVETYTDEGNPINAQALTLKGTIESEADAKLKEAVRLEQNDEYTEAANIVAEISVRFDNGETEKDKQVKVCQDALQEIGRMNGRRELKELIRDAVDAEKAEVRLDEAKDLEGTEQFEAALAVYEQMLIDFEDKDAEKDAKRAIVRIKRDKDIRKAIATARAERMADRYLDLGERYTRNRMYEEAKEAYESLLAEHPKSSAAEIAKRALADLPV